MNPQDRWYRPDNPNYGRCEGCIEPAVWEYDSKQYPDRFWWYCEACAKRLKDQE